MLQLSKEASEAKAEQQAAFIARMAQYHPDALLCLDEVYKDDRTCRRAYGYGRKGAHV